MFSKRKKNKILSARSLEIDPDEIFLDSSNLPDFDTTQFEGRFEKPITNKAIYLIALFFIIVIFVFSAKLWNLQISEGEVFASVAQNNRLNHSVIFARRGIIYDRNGLELVWNDSVNKDEDDNERRGEIDFLFRRYLQTPGSSHVLGFVNYPARDNHGFYFREEIEGRDGVEFTFNELLNGENGKKIIEADVFNEIISSSVIRPAVDGENVTLSIDSRLNSALYEIISTTAEAVGFEAGAGVMIDIETGEIIVLTSFPEYDPNILSQGQETSIIAGYSTDRKNPYLNRVLRGVYTPGSIVKPFVAAGALNENIIDPNKQIMSSGSISVANPYVPGTSSIFRDWRAHGMVDMRRAIAVSSNVYFYVVGGGFRDQRGLGISNIEKYIRMFGFGESTGVDLGSDSLGLVPNPEWKRRTFDGDDWRLGDTYHTAIGQYGFQVTPIQTVRAVAAIANGGKLIEPTILLGDGKINQKNAIGIKAEHLNIVREGMRQTVVSGTATGLNVPYVKIAAKTGTAELGALKEFVNSWTVGFFPYDEPKYAFVVVMERGPRANLIGGVSVSRRFFDWVSNNAPEYFGD